MKKINFYEFKKCSKLFAETVQPDNSTEFLSLIAS